VRIFHAATSLLSKLAVGVAALILVLMSALILLEIITRTGFSLSTHMMNEIVGYGIAAMSFLALGYSLEQRALIRMNLLIGALNPDGAARRIIEIICCLLGLFASGIVCYYFSLNVARNFVRGYVSETIAEVPLWIPESFVVVGLAVFFLQLLSHLIRVITGTTDLSAAKAAEFGFE